MDIAQLEALKVAAMTILGVIWQRWRLNPSWPNWVAWIVIPASSVAAWLFATPGWNMGDWRLSILSLYTFIMAARGTASTTADFGVLPRSK